ncbi:MAG: capsule assembly Wzi family protein [bacterium]
MKSFITKIAVVLLFYVGLNSAYAGLQETLPTYHWGYDYIDQLWLRGYFRELFILNRPYSRGEIAKAIMAINEEEDQRKGIVSKQDAWLLFKLQQEFESEIEKLQRDSFKARTLVGSYFIEDVSSDQNDFTDHTRVRTRFSISPTSNLSIFNAISFDNRLDDDPRYIGERQNGLAGFTEQAYVRLNWRKINFVLGRDFIRWGSGQSATLLISDQVRPMDVFLVSFGRNKFKFTFFMAMLDATSVPDTTGGFLRTAQANRYLAAHRLEVKIGSWLNLGLTEAILYGGINRTVEFSYLNPLLFFHGNLLNGPGDGNTFGTIDWYLLPHRNIGFYGTFMIDDIQLEKSSVGDLEPNELGWLLGARVADPLSLKGSNFLIEYTRVTNRTYNTLRPDEKFLHRNFPIGHYLGNDFDRWHIQWRQWFRSDVEITASFEQVRKGQGDVYAPFDTPWEQFTLEQGYHEPFPTGIVEKTQSANLKILYHPIKQLRISLDTKFRHINNLSHISGVDDDGWLFQLNLWWAPEVSVPLRFLRQD